MDCAKGEEEIHTPLEYCEIDESSMAKLRPLKLLGWDEMTKEMDKVSRRPFYLNSNG